MESIVVGTDGSETATAAVRHAAQLARRVQARVHVVTGYQPPTGAHLAAGAGAAEAVWALQPDMDALLERAGEIVREHGVEFEVHARNSDPADALIAVAEQEDADLIVVGSRGMTGSRRFLLGSVPNKVSHHAPCSVLVVRTT
jgi:nucleotide-binding universal stress UspA family protein